MSYGYRGDEDDEESFRRSLAVADERGAEIVRILLDRGLPLQVADSKDGELRAFRVGHVRGDREMGFFWMAREEDGATQSLYVEHPDTGRRRRTLVTTVVRAFVEHDATSQRDCRTLLRKAKKAGESDLADLWTSADLSTPTEPPAETARAFAERIASESLGAGASPETREAVIQLTMKYAPDHLPRSTEEPSSEYAQRSGPDRGIILALVIVCILAAFCGALVVLLVGQM